FPETEQFFKYCSGVLPGKWRRPAWDAVGTANCWKQSRMFDPAGCGSVDLISRRVPRPSLPEMRVREHVRRAVHRGNQYPASDRPGEQFSFGMLLKEPAEQRFEL